MCFFDYTNIFTVYSTYYGYNGGGGGDNDDWDLGNEALGKSSASRSGS